MPVQLSYPGVYIEEVPSGVRSIAGVATSIAAFVGYTRKGVPDKAATITSFADFERNYGGLDRDSPVSYAVRQFFLNGGTQAVIVRVSSGHRAAKWTLSDTTSPSPVQVLDVEASSPGAWANKLRITIQTDPADISDPPVVRNPDADFNLIVSELQDDGVTLVVRETHRNLNMDSRSPQYVESVVNNASALIRVTRKSLTFDQKGFALSTHITSFSFNDDKVISGVLDGTINFTLTLSSAITNMGELVDAVNSAITNAGLTTLLSASESGKDGKTGGVADKGYLKLVSLTPSPSPNESSSVVLNAGAFGGLAAAIGIGLANGGREIPGNAQHRPNKVSAVAPGVSGLDGSRGGVAELLGHESTKTGIYALRDVDLFNLLLIPETFDMTEGQETGLIPAAVTLCEEKRAFYIIDAPSDRTISDIAAWANSSPQSRNAATYYPAVRIVDPLDGFRAKSMAPSGTVAGIYARTDASRGVWKAPAGTDATLNGVVDLSLPMNDLENGNINTKGVNALRSFPAYGRIVWGARTMKGSDVQADEYKYIPVRRLALFLEESLYRGTQWVVFEPNDEPLWAQIRLNLGAFMQNLFRQGAFQGRSPREAYFVKCDRETTTQNDIDLGIVNIVVGFAPLKPAEFVVIKLQQIAGQIQA